MAKPDGGGSKIVGEAGSGSFKVGSIFRNVYIRSKQQIYSMEKRRLAILIKDTEKELKAIRGLKPGMGMYTSWPSWVDDAKNAYNKQLKFAKDAHNKLK